jgi:hypothetical protein
MLALAGVRWFLLGRRERPMPFRPARIHHRPLLPHNHLLPRSPMLNTPLLYLWMSRRYPRPTTTTTTSCQYHGLKTGPHGYWNKECPQQRQQQQQQQGRPPRNQWGLGMSLSRFQIPMGSYHPRRSIHSFNPSI